MYKEKYFIYFRSVMKHIHNISKDTVMSRATQVHISLYIFNTIGYHVIHNYKISFIIR